MPRAALVLFAAGLLAGGPTAAQNAYLAYSEDCSRAATPLVQEACDGTREVQLRERLRRIGMKAVAAPEQAQVQVQVAIDIRLAGAYMQELRSGKRVRDLTTTSLLITIKREDAPPAESKFELDSQQCGTDQAEAPAYFVLAALAKAGVRPAEVARLIVEEVAMPFGVCGAGNTEEMLSTLRGARDAVVPALKPLLADRKRSSDAAHVLGAMGSGEGTAALRRRVETVLRAKSVASLQAAIDLTSAFAEHFQWVPAAEVEPRAKEELRELLRLLSAPPHPAQKQRLYAKGMFYDHLLETLRTLLEPVSAER